MRRQLAEGMGQAVGERTILRYQLTPKLTQQLRSEQPIKINPRDPHYQRWNTGALNAGLEVEVVDDAPMRDAPDTVYETWQDVATRVADGNASLVEQGSKQEFRKLHYHLSKATLLMSGRHLQHGDKTQPLRNMEVFTNCATSSSTFMLFYLLLNGAGVGRDYSDGMMLVDWDHAPALRCVLDSNHPDFDYSAHESVRDARHKYTAKDTFWYKVPDSREGWSTAIEIFENAAFEKIHSHKLLILDFSDVRPKGAPIRGMQNRPSSGPVPLMNALLKVASLKGGKMPKWMQAMYADHYVAECVLVGGARRAARMATKHWKDTATIYDFVGIKRPIEYSGAKMDDVIAYRKSHPVPRESFLWSSNNSVLVDAEFWHRLALKRGDENFDHRTSRHARKLYKLITEFSYGDGTGEPGLINVDQLADQQDGIEKVLSESYIGSSKFKPRDETQLYLKRLGKRVVSRIEAGISPFIVNPCGEITLALYGGFCVIADVVPYHADTLDEAFEAFRVATRALMRVNLMDSVYSKEVRRTNRIGVGMTGVHEFAWKFFKVGFRDLIHGAADPVRFDERPKAGSKDPHERAAAFWNTLREFNHTVLHEAYRYAQHLGVAIPHTALTIKPAGTTSKLFGLTEGWHLPSMAHFLRWVQFRNDDPLVADYRLQGYPTKELVTYEGTTVVGFPTQPAIAALGLGDALVTAGEATMREQYEWLMRGEFYYIKGGNKEDQAGNQISYTLKYRPDEIDYATFKETMATYQPYIRCCSVMPQEEGIAYEYQPEEPITKAQYESITAKLTRTAAEDVDLVHVDCATGACPVDFEKP